MLKLYFQGSRFAIYLWMEEDGSCSVADYLRGLRTGGKPQKQDLETLEIRRLRYTGDHGPPYNDEQCHKMVGSDDVFEFKASNGARLGWFYSPELRGVVICTHGFHKPPSNRAYGPEIKRVEEIREKHKAEIARFKAQQAAPTGKRKTAKSKGRRK